MEANQDDEARNSLQHLYEAPLSAAEADEAMQNLVGLFDVLLEIKQEGGSHAAYQ